jgi:hypothetical protein
VSAAPRLIVVAITVVLAVAAVLAVATSCGDDDDEQPLTWQQLRNATYPSSVTPDREITLTNGQAAENEDAQPYARLVSVGAFGDIDGEDGDDTAVLLAERSGDGEQVTSLIAVLNDDGEPNVEGSVELGTNVAIRALEIIDEEIVVEAFPTELVDTTAGQGTIVSRRYKLGRDGLELTDESTGQAEVRSPQDFEFNPEPLTPTPGGTATIDRTLEPRAIAPFMIEGAEGQRVKISLSSAHDSAVLSIQGLGDESQPVPFRDYATSFDAELPGTQDYAVNVISVSGSDLDVTIEYDLAEPPATPSPAPTPISPPQTTSELATAVPRTFEGLPTVADAPLDEISATAAGFIPGRAPLRGIAVLSPDDGVVWVDNPDEEMETASVIKVAVMTCVMASAEQQGRLVSEWELSLMWPMITQSNNDATDALWSELGGGPGMAACLGALSVAGITPYNGPYWGTSTASARGMATLVSRLAYGDIVNAEHRAAALEMLVSVISSQRWGVPAGADSSGEEIVGVKDGWYPDDDGWRVNSVGFISPLSPNDVPYAIAVMTNLQTTQEYGIATIEGLTEPVWTDIRAR